MSGLLREAITRDLRNACIHEYAHAAVARHFGYRNGWVDIEPNTRGGLSEKYFVGRFHYPGELRGHAVRLLGLAGSVAEILLTDPDAEGWEMLDWLHPDYGVCGPLSPTDAELAGNYTEADLDECIAILREHWAEIEQQAQHHASAFLSRVGGVE